MGETRNASRIFGGETSWEEVASKKEVNIKIDQKERGYGGERQLELSQYRVQCWA
jgi:hypothetical protein